MTNTVKIEGVELHKRKTVRNSRVPGPSAKLVLTDTTKHTLRLMAEAVNLNEPVVLEGETSAGKSAATLYLSYRTKTPIYWVNLCEQTDPSELIGKYVPTEDSDRFEWMDGTLIRAMKEGAWLFLDDINLAPSSILERMNSLLDEDACITVTEHTGEPVRPAEGFRLFAARNPLTYQGRQRLSVAFVNKFTQIYVEEQTDDEKVKILSKRGVDKSTAHAMVEFAGKLIAGMEEEKLDRSRLGGYRFGLRDLLRWSEYIETYTTNEEQELSTAFGRGAMYVYYDRLETKEARKVCFDLLSQCSIDGASLDLAEILEGRDVTADIKPTVAELFMELTRGADDWALDVTKEQLTSDDTLRRLAAIGVVLALPVRQPLLFDIACDEMAAFLADEDAVIRQSAVESFGRLAGNTGLSSASMSRLSAIANTSPNADVRDKVVGFLGNQSCGDVGLGRLFLYWLKNTRELEVRRTATYALRNCISEAEKASDPCSDLRRPPVSADGLRRIRKDAVEALVGALQDPELGAIAADVLGDIADSTPGPVEALLKVLSGPRDTEALTHRTARSLIKLLQKAKKSEPDSDGRVTRRTLAENLSSVVQQRRAGFRWAILSLGELGCTDREVIDLLLGIIRDDEASWQAQRAAGSALVSLAAHETQLWEDVALLLAPSGSSLRSRRNIGGALASAADKSEVVRDALRKRSLEDPYLLCLLFNARSCSEGHSWAIGSVDLSHALMQWIRNLEPKEVPIEALTTLRALEVGDDEVVCGILDVLRESQDKYARAYACEALADLGKGRKEVLEALARAAEQDHDEEVRARALRVLLAAFEGCPRTHVLLVDVVRSGSAKLLPIAARALLDMKSVTDVVLKSLLERAREGSGVRYAIEALSLVNYDAPAFREFLKKTVQNGDVEARLQAACALGQLGEPCNGLRSALREFFRPEPRFNEATRWVRNLCSSGVKPASELLGGIANLDHKDRKDLLRVVGDSILSRIKSDAFEEKRAILERNRDRISLLYSSGALAQSSHGFEIERTGSRGVGPLVPDEEIAELVLTRSTVSHLRSLLRAVRLNHAVALVGETGVGKTALIRFLAYLTNNNYVRINLKDMAEVSELVGGYVPTEDGTLIWKDGLLVEAMKKGYWVVLDEANLAGPGVLERLNQLLDRDGYLELQEKGEKDSTPIRADKDFRLFVTMNPTDYAGRNAMSPAFVNRFVVKWYEKPTSKELTAIVKTQYDVSEGMARRLVTFHQGIADSAEHRELGRQRAERYVYTLRDLQALMSRVKRLGNGSGIPSDDLVRCVRDVYGARLSHDEDRELFETHLKACFN